MVTFLKTYIIVFYNGLKSFQNTSLYGIVKISHSRTQFLKAIRYYLEPSRLPTVVIENC